MKILITGGCGFVGSNLAIFLKKNIKDVKIFSLDNLYRKGSKINEKRLNYYKIKNLKININNYKKLSKLQKFDLILDCCAEPAIEASTKNPDQIINTNLLGTYNVLKKCVIDKCGIIFLSTSRVYSIQKLNSFYKHSLKKINYKLKINEKFETSSPKSLYGLSKLASEDLIKEFNYSHNIKFIINRFGVISGPWQFGKQDQGFISLWMERHINNKKLKYIGFGGKGLQSRDILHINDACDLILMQIKKFSSINNKTFNVGGGAKNTLSLKQLTQVCEKITNNKIKIDKIKQTSIFDIPNYITNNSKVYKYYKWKPKNNVNNILIDIFNWIKFNKKLVQKYF